MHCEFEVGSTTVALRDVGSRNGTIVNGEKIDEIVQLKVGDLVEVGPMRLELESTAPMRRVGSIAPHVADESQVADSIVDWLQQEQPDMSETTSFPLLSVQNTPDKKFNDVAAEGADIIRRHLEGESDEDSTE